MSESDAIDRHILFAIEYVKDWNGTRAAARVGFKGSDATLAVTASRLLRTAKVRKKINELVSAHSMGIEEVLGRLSEHARLDISLFFKRKRMGDNDDHFVLNWGNIKKYGFLIKSITHTKYGPKIELHDSQKALELLGRAHQMFTDNVNVNADIDVKGYQDVSPDNWDDTTENATE